MTAGSLVWLWAPMASSAGFTLVAPTIARRMGPRIATWLLSAGGVLLAASAIVLPSLVLLLAVGQWSPLASLGRWEPRALHTGQPFGPNAWVVAAAVLGTQLGLAAWVSWRKGRPLLAAWRSARNAKGALVVLEDERPAVFALPGWPGRIITTDSLLATLTPTERRVVMAHEQAHLDGRHDLHITAGAVCAALNPLLAGLPRALDLATERWADERAARVIGGRRTVAEAIVAVGTRCSPDLGSQELHLGMADRVVIERVRCLLGRPSRARVVVGVLGILLATLSVGAAVGAAAQTNAAFQHAERVFVSAPSLAAAGADPLR